MSAYVVTFAHIDLILTAALNLPLRMRDICIYHDDADNHPELNPEAGYIGPSRFKITRANATEVGRMLLRENTRSVTYKYNVPEGSTDMPGKTDETGLADLYQYRPFAGAHPHPKLWATAFNAVRSLNYQSCETPDWEATIAHATVATMIEWFGCALADHHDPETVGWSIGDGNRGMFTTTRRTA